MNNRLLCWVWHRKTGMDLGNLYCETMQWIVCWAFVRWKAKIVVFRHLMIDEL